MNTSGAYAQPIGCTCGSDTSGRHWGDCPWSSDTPVRVNILAGPVISQAEFDALHAVAQAARAWVAYMDAPDFDGSHEDEARMLGAMRDGIAALDAIRGKEEGRDA